jgi:N-methylhydantoinase B
MNYLTRAGGTPAVFPAKFYGQLRRGDLFVHETAAGGGWGDPLERDAERVLKDVRNEFVSAENVGKLYGVVLAADGRSVDMAATEALRAKLRKARGWQDTPYALRETPALAAE